MPLGVHRGRHCETNPYARVIGFECDNDIPPLWQESHVTPRGISVIHIVKGVVSSPVRSIPFCIILGQENEVVPVKLLIYYTLLVNWEKWWRYLEI